MYKEDTLGDYIENSVLGSLGIYTGTPGNIIALEHHRRAQQPPPIAAPYTPPVTPPPPITPDPVIFNPAASNPAPPITRPAISHPANSPEECEAPLLWKLKVAAYIASMLAPLLLLFL